MVSKPVSVKFGIGKKSWNRYRKKLVSEKKVSEPKFGTEKSTGIGIKNIWYRKKYWYQYRLAFWVPSHTGWDDDGDDDEDYGETAVLRLA